MASQPTTLYAILNLTPQATKEEIKESYLREALLTHPDKNVENIAEANARFAQLQNAFKMLYDERKRMEYDMATFGTSRDGPQVKVENPEERNMAEEKEEEEEDVELYESISREFARGAWRERVDEERMAESSRKIDESLDEMEHGCENLDESLERFEETINDLKPVIEWMFGKSTAGGDGQLRVFSDVNALATEHEDSP